MPRPCSSCNKLASLEVGEPEVNNEDFESDTGGITLEYRLVKNSACCGDEMKEYTFELEGSAEDEIDAHIKEKHADDPARPSFSMDVAVEATERSQTHDRHGKPIKNFRYSKSYTGVSASCDITCEKCSEVIATVELSDETQNGSFDEI